MTVKEKEPALEKDFEVEKCLSPILQFWVTVYRAIPKIYVPFTEFNISFTLVTFVVLRIVRLFSDIFFEEMFGWPEDSKMKNDSAAGLASMLHACLLVPSIAVLLRSDNYSPSARIDSMPNWWQDVANAMLEMCTGYMLSDSFGMMMDTWVPGKGPSFTDGDSTFLAHHFATSFFMCSCRIVGAGHMSALILMWAGEFSNPLGNLMIITRYGIKLEAEDTLWHVIHPYVEYSYAVVFSIFRAIIGPVTIMHLTYDLILTKQGRENVPIFLSLFIWMPMVWGVILGSIPWTYEAIAMVLDGVHTVKYDASYDYGPRYEL